MTFENGAALVGREQAGERARLAQPRGGFAVGAKQRQELGEWHPVEQALPLEERPVRRAGDPSRQVGACHIEQFRPGFDLGGDRLVQRQTATVDPGMRAHASSIDWDAAGRAGARRCRSDGVDLAVGRASFLDGTPRTDSWQNRCQP